MDTFSTRLEWFWPSSRPTVCWRLEIIRTPSCRYCLKTPVAINRSMCLSPTTSSPKGLSLLNFPTTLCYKTIYLRHSCEYNILKTMIPLCVHSPIELQRDRELLLSVYPCQKTSSRYLWSLWRKACWYPTPRSSHTQTFWKPLWGTPFDNSHDRIY